MTARPARPARPPTGYRLPVAARRAWKHFPPFPIYPHICPDFSHVRNQAEACKEVSDLTRNSTLISVLLLVIYLRLCIIIPEECYA
jgi:hypothetical protein